MKIKIFIFIFVMILFSSFIFANPNTKLLQLYRFDTNNFENYLNEKYIINADYGSFFDEIRTTNVFLITETRKSYYNDFISSEVNIPKFSERLRVYKTEGGAGYNQIFNLNTYKSPDSYTIQYLLNRTLEDPDPFPNEQILFVSAVQRDPVTDNLLPDRVIRLKMTYDYLILEKGLSGYMFLFQINMEGFGDYILISLTFYYDDFSGYQIELRVSDNFGNYETDIIELSESEANKIINNDINFFTLFDSGGFLDELRIFRGLNDFDFEALHNTNNFFMTYGFDNNIYDNYSFDVIIDYDTLFYFSNISDYINNIDLKGYDIFYNDSLINFNYYEDFWDFEFESLKNYKDFDINFTLKHQYLDLYNYSIFNYNFYYNVYENKTIDNITFNLDDYTQINLSEYYLAYKNFSIDDLNININETKVYDTFQNEYYNITLNYIDNHIIINLKGFNNIFNETFNYSICSSVNCIDNSFNVKVIDTDPLFQFENINNQVANMTTSLFLNFNNYYFNYNYIELFFSGCGYINISSLDTTSFLDCGSFNVTLDNNYNEYTLFLNVYDTERGIYFYSDDVLLTINKYNQEIQDNFYLEIYNNEFISVNFNYSLVREVNGVFEQVLPRYNSQQIINVYSFNNSNENNMGELLYTFNVPVNLVDTNQKANLTFSYDENFLFPIAPYLIFERTLEGFLSETILLNFHDNINEYLSYNLVPLRYDEDYERPQSLFHLDLVLENIIIIISIILICLLLIFLVNNETLSLFGCVGLIAVGFILLFNNFNIIISIFLVFLGIVISFYK